MSESNPHQEHIARLDAYLRPKTKVQGYTMAEVEQRIRDWESLLEQLEALRKIAASIYQDYDLSEVDTLALSQALNPAKRPT